MGKYMRKCRGAGGAGTAKSPAAAMVVAGVRTRSRSAAVAMMSAAAEELQPPKRPRKAPVATRHDDGDADAGCYLRLRSRRLFMVAAPEAVNSSSREPVPVPAQPSSTTAVPPLAGSSQDSTEAAAAAAAGVSRCSSTASSSVDVAALRERSGCATANKSREDDCDVESSVSDSACCWEGRETTPSRRPPGDVSDQESSEAAHADRVTHHLGRSSAATATTACRTKMMPPPEEIEEFFAAAEKAEVQRFAAKYNFDVVRGVPLDAGRFEWTPVPSG